MLSCKQVNNGTRIGVHKNMTSSFSCCAVGVSENNPLKGNENGSVFDEPDSSVTTFGTLLDAEITPETIDFFVSDAHGDPDCPSQGFSSIEQALSTLRQGKVYYRDLYY